VQIRQLKAEVARLEGDANTLSKEVRTAQAQIAQSTTKQQALSLQRTLEHLESEKQQVLAEQEQLGDPSASVTLLEQAQQRESNSLETQRARVRDMQNSVKEMESRLSSMRSSGDAGMCVPCALCDACDPAEHSSSKEPL
jgi:predicted  nucleic acid-binding Zn-ribbon protein